MSATVERYQRLLFVVVYTCYTPVSFDHIVQILTTVRPASCILLLNASPLPRLCPDFGYPLRSYVRVQQTGDPSYSTYDDLSTYTNVKVRLCCPAACFLVNVGAGMMSLHLPVDDLSRSVVVL